MTGTDCAAYLLLAQTQRRSRIFQLLSTRKVSQLALVLAQDVARRYPPAIANNPVQMVSPRRVRGILKEIFVRTEDLAGEKRLGWFQRTRLGNDFRRELNELGYDEDFVDSAEESLIAYLTQSPAGNSR